MRNRSHPYAGIECVVVTTTVKFAEVETLAGVTVSCAESEPVLILRIACDILKVIEPFGVRKVPLKAEVVPAYIGLVIPFTINSKMVS